jgi:hypothetical protein
VDHFNGLFKESNQIRMGSILKKIAFFPHLLLDEDNVELLREVFLKELWRIISSFKKRKP